MHVPDCTCRGRYGPIDWEGHYGVCPSASTRATDIARIIPRDLAETIAIALDLDVRAASADAIWRPANRPPHWLTELLRSMRWKVVVEYDFVKAAHININEQRVYNMLLKRLAVQAPVSRPPYLGPRWSWTAWWWRAAMLRVALLPRV